MNKHRAALFILLIIAIACAAMASVAHGQSIAQAVPVQGSIQALPAGSGNGSGLQRIPLHGEWEFYWQQLLEPGQFQPWHSSQQNGQQYDQQYGEQRDKQHNQQRDEQYVQQHNQQYGEQHDQQRGHDDQSPDQAPAQPQQSPRSGMAPAYIAVPSSWEDEPAAGRSSYGYGTYRLRIQVPESDIGKGKALFIRSIGSAYRLWIDGKEKPGLGVVGTSRQAEVAQAHLNLIFLQVERSEIEIVIQASNYSFREGGIISDIEYGDTAALIPSILRAMLYDLFIIGGFTMIGCYQLVIYGLRRREAASLYLGLLFLAFAARTLFINGYICYEIIGIHNWELLVKLEYLSEIAVFLLFVLLMRHLYPREAHRFMVYAAYVLACGLSVYVLLTPARVYTETMIWQTAGKGLILAYFVLYVGVAAVWRKREGSRILLCAVLICLAALANDTLYWLRWADTEQMLSVAAIIFLLAQAITISYRYSRLSTRNDTLVAELGAMNTTLEEKVAVRTQKLSELNEQLSEMKAVRNKMLVNIAHDLSSPLVGVQTYLHLMQNGKLPAGRSDIIALLSDRIDYVQRLTTDLFELSKLEEREQALQLAAIKAGDWLEAVYGKLERDLEREGVVLQRGRWEARIGEQEAHITVDRMRILQVMQNYTDNAVKFSRGKSTTITLSGYVETRVGGGSPEFVVEVADEGIGIPQEELQHVFRRFYKKRDGNEQGSGLGLAIVKEIIDRHQGTVGVRSELGRGSTFFFTLPVRSGVE